MSRPVRADPPPMLPARGRRWRLVLAALLALLLVISLVWDWNWFRGPLERGVERRTGRTLSIDGDLHIALGWQPQLTLERVRFGNPPWTRRRDMFSAERAEVRIDLRQLLAGRVVLPSVELVAPRVDLETAADGRQSWQLLSPGQKDDHPAADLPQIGGLRVERGELRYFDPAQDTDLVFAVATQGAEPTGALQVKAHGRFRALAVEGAFTGATLLARTQFDAPYPFHARIRVGQTRATADGSVTGLPVPRAARLQIDLRGDSLGALHALTALVLPETPPYHIAGLLVREGDRWTLDDFRGQVGDSDLSGDATVTYAQNRPRLAARLESRQLDLDDLAGFVGATPGTGRGETASAQQQRQAIREQASPRVLPDTTVNLTRLRSMDADVHFSGLSIRNKKAPLDNMTVHLVLDQGVLHLDPLNFGVAGGAINSSVKIDAREPTLSMSAKLDFARLDLARLLPGDSRMAAGAGLIGGRAQFSGSGNSTAALLAGVNGDLGIAMRDGQFSNLLVEGIGLDAAESLRLLVGGDRRIRLRCAVMDFAARDGVLTPRSFVVDTTDTNLHVDGSLNLRDETLDLSIHPLPKDFSPLSLRSPLHLRGTFRNPTLRPDKALFLRGGVAAVLGALVNPLLALLPLIETGPGKNEDCDALVAAARRQVAPGPPT